MKERTSKKVCMFCMRAHKVRPMICTAKADIVSAYLRQGVKFWQVLAGIHSGLINLQGEALVLVAKRRSRK